MPRLPSRRTVLKLGLASGLAVGAGVALALRKTALRSPTPQLAALDARSYAILAALAERLCPAAGEGAPGATQLGLAQTLDGVLAAADADAREGVIGALGMLENALGGALVGERVTPFTQLDAAGQDAALASFRDSSLGVRRTIFRALFGIVMAVYWGDPRTWARLGYGGPPSVESLRELYRDNLVDLDSLRATPLAKGA